MNKVFSSLRSKGFRRRREFWVSCSTLAIALLASSSVAYGAWEAVPEVSLLADNNDNILRTQNNSQSASSMQLGAGVTLSNFGERGNFFVAPSVVTDSYSGSENKAYESDDIFLAAGGQYNWRTSSVGFRTRYRDQLILDSEFADLAPDDPDLSPGDEFVDPDTGRLVLVSQQRETLDFRGNLDFSLSARNTLRFELARQDVDYSGDVTTFRSAYDNNALGMTFLRRVDERSTASATLNVSEFNAERTGNTSDSVSLQGRLTRPLSQTWTISVNGGVERTDYDFLGAANTRVNSSSTNPTLGVSFRKRAERSRWNLDLLRRVQPIGNGYLVERSQIRAYVAYDFSPRLVGTFATLLTDTKALDDLRTADDRKYLRLGFELEWALRPTLFLRFGVDQLTQEFVNDASGKATSNSVFVGMTYRGRSRQNAP